MATTTNYSWVTPDDTNLVKDGASAIRTLGSSIDTTTKNLNPSTTLGDIQYRSSTANTNTRLGIGLTGEVLTVAGGVPTWAAIPAGGGMTLISTTTMNTTTVNLSSIPQTYRDLYVVIRNFRPTTNTNSLQLRINGDATANRHVQNIGFGNTATSTFNGTIWDLDGGTNSTTQNGLHTIRIPDYTNTTTWKTGQNCTIVSDPTTATSFKFTNTNNAYNQLGAVTSLLFIVAGAGMTAGTCLLYGVK